MLLNPSSVHTDGCPNCPPPFPPTTGNAAALSEHNQILFGLALCLPLIGHFFGFKVMYDYYGRPGFFWRLLLNIALTGMLTVGGFAIAMEWTELSPAALATRVPRFQTRGSSNPPCMTSKISQEQRLTAARSL
ncbi:hypothetical protein RBA41_13770 [Massilia sp. CCM 9210]|uniref:hypothetical protein n=1 Tax=Massilia scottii TaxID=3057166 RepID=UPI0027964042|nr:hypothetical protein [Massilia sp. CCM 9210]MDQ1814376.1 hypothetical protein [Massilia sp. CCM 9210]